MTDRKLVVTISPKQQRGLQRRIMRAGTGSLEQEIRKAITQYLAGSKQIEAFSSKS